MTTKPSQFVFKHSVVDGIDTLECSGIIDENITLQIAEWQNTMGKRVNLRLRDIEWVNSSGMRAWSIFMRAFIEGREVSFEECSSAIMQQVNMVPNFLPLPSIHSFMVPFACDTCHTQTNVLVRSIDCKPPVSKPITQPVCGKCGATMNCQEDLNDYLFFLEPS